MTEGSNLRDIIYDCSCSQPLYREKELIYGLCDFNLVLKHFLNTISLLLEQNNEIYRTSAGQ